VKPVTRVAPSRYAQAVTWIVAFQTIGAGVMIGDSRVMKVGLDDEGRWIATNDAYERPERKIARISDDLLFGASGTTGLIAPFFFGLRNHLRRTLESDPLVERVASWQPWDDSLYEARKRLNDSGDGMDALIMGRSARARGPSGEQWMTAEVVCISLPDRPGDALRIQEAPPMRPAHIGQDGEAWAEAALARFQNPNALLDLQRVTGGARNLGMLLAWELSEAVGAAAPATVSPLLFAMTLSSDGVHAIAGPNDGGEWTALEVPPDEGMDLIETPVGRIRVAQEVLPKANRHQVNVRDGEAACYFGRSSDTPVWTEDLELVAAVRMPLDALVRFSELVHALENVPEVGPSEAGGWLEMPPPYALPEANRGAIRRVQGIDGINVQLDFADGDDSPETDWEPRAAFTMPVDAFARLKATLLQQVQGQLRSP
jgi:hypothetical protein